MVVDSGDCYFWLREFIEQASDDPINDNLPNKKSGMNQSLTPTQRVLHTVISKMFE